MTGPFAAFRLTCAALAWSIAASCFAAEPSVISAPDAQSLMQSGQIVLIDIRSRQEWAETGVAEGAWPVSLHEPDFSQRFQEIINRYPNDQVALICATGGRTAHVVGVLERNGISGVVDVSEGMMGNRTGPGWIARGMSVVPLDVAQDAYLTAFPGE